MQFTIKGILSYPHLFKPHAVSEGEEPKYSCAILLRKDDPQLAEVRAGQLLVPRRIQAEDRRVKL